MPTSHQRSKPNRNWFRTLLQLRGSVIPSILPRVIFCCIFSLLITGLYFFGINLSLPLESGIVPSIVLGLLLVFRTNTAYERFWEGRKLWGTLIITTRNFSRTLWVAIEERSPEDRKEKIDTLRLLVAFAIASKLHLRGEPINEEVRIFIAENQYEKLKTMNNPPLEIAFWMSDYLQYQYDRNCLNVHQLTAMQYLIDTIVGAHTGCERVLNTPIPLAYAIHLKQLLVIYCLTLPFQLVDNFGWWTAFFVALTSFTVFGIEEIGIEIENPFGHDKNDLPLDQFCQTMQRNIEDLIALPPSVRHWQRKNEKLNI